MALEENELDRDLVFWVHTQTGETRLRFIEVCVAILNLRTAHQRIEALYAAHTAERSTCATNPTNPTKHHTTQHISLISNHHKHAYQKHTH